VCGLPEIVSDMAKVDEEKLEILSRCRPGPIGLPATAV